MSATLRDWIVPALLVLLTVVCLGLIVFDELTGRQIDATIQTILAFIVGVLSHQLGTQQGSTQTSQAIRQGQSENTNGFTKAA